MADQQNGASLHRVIISNMEELRRSLEDVREKVSAQGENRYALESRLSLIANDIQELKGIEQRIRTLENFVLVSQHDLKKRDRILWTVGGTALIAMVQQVLRWWEMIK